MKSKILTVILYLTIISTVKTEEAFFADLFGLVYDCPIIFTAVLLPASEYTATPQNNQYSAPTIIRSFLVKDIIKSGLTALPGTIQVSGWENYIFEAQTNWRTGEREPFSIDSLQVFVFFGTYHVQDKYRVKNTFLPFTSGIRAFRNDSMYVADQTMNPGPHHFHYGEKITLTDFIKKTHRTITRLEEVLKIRQVRPLSERNKIVLEWIKTHNNDLLTSQPIFFMYKGDSEKNWGKLKWVVFEWVSESGIWQDIWKAMEISSSAVVLPDNQYSFSYRPGETHNAFANTEARLFLCEKLKDIHLNPILLYPTLNVLYESIYTRSDKRPVFALNQLEQLEIIFSAAVAADINQDNLLGINVLTHALWVIEAAAFPIKSDLPPFYDESVLYMLKSNRILETENPIKESLIKIIQRMEQSKR